MTNVWTERFPGGRVPEWLVAFDTDADMAVDALLRGRVYFGSPPPAGPGDLLVDWALVLGESDGFLARLDAALTRWVERNWGQTAGMIAARRADAWSRLANLVGHIHDLKATASALRSRFDESQEVLGPLSVAPSR